MMKPPNYPSAQMEKAKSNTLTYYDEYGTAGQSWYAVDLGCSDAMSMVGNAVSNVVFTMAKALDRTTITVYQSAASSSLLSWLKGTVDGVIRGMGNTFGARYWSWVVVLGALWLAWWGLIRKRASRVTEGTVWMVMAMVALIWLIARPGDFTSLGTKVSDATTVAFDAALPQSNASTTCLPGGSANSASENAVTRNANGLWVTLVCKPWLMGEFGTDNPNSKIVQADGSKLLSSQAVNLSETYGAKQVSLNQKSTDYQAVTSDVQNNYPGTFSLFQGKDWTSRLAVAFGALFAALFAGLLVLLISVMLIVMKIAFLLLLVAGPIFLGIGIHPGIGRVIAIRWFELLLSTLLKQAALIGVLTLLLWAYGLVMSQGLPWGLQILLISLVTVAAFIYRKPFQHLFAAVGYSAVGSRSKSDEHMEKSIRETRDRTAAVAKSAMPGGTGYRFARWARLAGANGATDAQGAGGEPTSGMTSTDYRSRLANTTGTGSTGRSASAPPLNLSSRSRSSSTTRDGLGAPLPRPGGTSSGGPSGSGTGGGSQGGGTVRPPASVGGGTAGSRPPASSGGNSSGRGTTPPPPRRPADGAAGRSGRDGSSGRAGRDGRDGRSGRDGTGRTGGGSGRTGGGTGRGGGAGKAGRDGRPGVQERGKAPSAPPLWGGGGKERPFWAGRQGDDSPPIPFWLRPVKRNDDE